MIAEATAVTELTVEAWRYRQLAAAGWPQAHAMIVADDSSVDLHLACDLLRNGCDRATAWRILR
jgi:hypothetical protein